MSKAWPSAHRSTRPLRRSGALVIVTPKPSHLRVLVDALGLLDVGADKQERLHATLAPQLQPVRRRELELTMTLDHDQLQALVAMGPSAHHVDSRLLDERIAKLPRNVRVGASLAIETFRARAATSASG